MNALGVQRVSFSRHFPCAIIKSNSPIPTEMPKTKRPTARTLRKRYPSSVSILTVRNARKRQQATMRKLVHHSRPIHKQILLHPATAMMLLVAGVLIAGWTFRVAAVTYDVHAKVPAPPLTEGAFITNPADGAHFTSSPITVSGSCPNDSYVTLIRNGSFSGTAWCNANIFSIDTSLTPGSDSLQAQDYNITDDPGPVTPSVHVTYTPPTPAPTPPGSSGGQTPAGTSGSGTTPVLSLDSNYHFYGYSIRSLIQWKLHVSGGTAPYKISVLWGDHNIASSTTYGRAFTIEHTYTTAGFYPIKIYATDAAGKDAMLQVFAVVRQLGATGALRLSSGTPGWWQELLSVLSNGSNRWLLVAWPTYATILLMTVSYWLGERQAMEHAVIAQRRSLRPVHRKY